MVKNSKIQSKFPKILLNEPLKKYSRYLIGGPADYLYTLNEDINERETLSGLIKYAKKHEIPFIILGMGSNILFDDKGFKGLVIRMQTKGIVFDGEKNEITADSGVLIYQLVKISLDNNYSGLEKWFYLPGTVGGAVYGNAGCHGLETKDILVSATLLDPKSAEIKEVDKDYFDFDYRYSILKKTKEIVLDATFKVKKHSFSPQEQNAHKEEILKFRSNYQPTGLSTGSFFKNPSPEKPAGMLIDQAGLKGKTIGQAQISQKHANFIINLGGASSQDIIELAELAKREVKAKFDIELQPEVQIIPEKIPPI